MSVNSVFAIPVQTSKPSKAVNIAIWGVQILTALAFLAVGGSKLTGAPAMVDMFHKIGFGQWFRYLTGSLEVTGAVLLLLPRTAAIGGWLLVVSQRKHFNSLIVELCLESAAKIRRHFRNDRRKTHSVSDQSPLRRIL